MIKNIKQQLPVIMTVLLVTIMAAAAELSGEKEIFFSEIAAIAAGALISPEFAWKMSVCGGRTYNFSGMHYNEENRFVCTSCRGVVCSGFPYPR